MNLDEAKHLARSWTSGIDVQLDGWRCAMKLLIDHIDELYVETCLMCAERLP